MLDYIDKININGVTYPIRDTMGDHTIPATNFEVVFSVDDGQILCNKTFAEIFAAIDDGMYVYSVYSNNIGYLSTFNSSTISFVVINANELTTLTMSNDNFINSTTTPIDISQQLQNYMMKGIDYVTAGQKSGSTLGVNATAEGNDVTASGTSSHAEGESTTASGNYSHAEGSKTTYYNDEDEEETLYTIASGEGSHAEGGGTLASGKYSHAEGWRTKSSNNYTHAEGRDTVASGNYGSHSEGWLTKATGEAAHAEGVSTKASGNHSHAEGDRTQAQGSNSHTEGTTTIASGTDSHAEGVHTTASGAASHAENKETVASGEGSHAEGFYTVAQRKSQHVFGEYNILDTTGTPTTRGSFVEIVGNGTDSVRSNARTLDWNGNEVLLGKLTVGSNPTNNMDVTTKQYVENIIGPKLDKSAITVSGGKLIINLN